MKMTVTTAAVCAFSALHGLALAESYTWTQGRSGSWKDATLWSPSGIPGSGDTVDFGGEWTGDAVVTAGDTGAVVFPANLFMTGSGALVFRGESASGRLLTVNNTATHLQWIGTWVFDGMDALFRISYPNNPRMMMGVGGTAYPAMLILRGDSRVTFDGTQLQMSGDDNAKGSLVEVTDAATLKTTSEFQPGRGQNTWGGVVQRGGTIQALGPVRFGYNANSFGTWEMFGGTATISGDMNLAYGAGSAAGLYVHGGTLTLSGNPHFGLVGRSEVFVDGGTLEFPNQPIRLVSRPSDQDAVDRPTVFTLAGSAQANGFALIPYGKNSTYDGSSRAMINLKDDAKLSLTDGFKVQATGPTHATLSFDGGTLERVTGSPDSDANHQLLAGVDAVVYCRGAKLAARKTDGSASAMNLTSAKFRAAGGYGVKAITVTGGGSGYMLPPLVTISGGSGSNATAIAQIDYANKTVTNVVVTCAGEGYAENDALTVTFVVPSAPKISSAAAVVTLARNESGPISIVNRSTVTLGAAFAFDGCVAAESGSTLKLNGGLRLMKANIFRSGIVNVTGDVTADFDFGTGPGGVVSVSSGMLAGDGRIKVEGGRFQLGTDSASGNDGKSDLIAPAKTLALGGTDASVSTFLMQRPGSGSLFSQTLAALELGTGRNVLAVGSDGTGAASLAFGAFASREAGALYYASASGVPTLAFGSFASGILCGTATPVLAGGIAADADGTSRGNPVRWNATSGAFEEMASWDDAFAADANVRVSDSVTVPGAAANALKLASGVKVTVPEGTSLGSGMVFFEPGNEAVTEIAGGTLTSLNGKDLILHDMHVTPRRNAEPAKAVVSARIVDPDDDTPMALVVSGYKNFTGQGNVLLKQGPLVKLLGANAHSGGTYLNDCALEAGDDAAFGKVPLHPAENIFIAGLSQIRPVGGTGTLTLGANRGIKLASGAVLSLTGSGNQTYAERVTVNGPVTGEGVLVSGEYAGTWGSRAVATLTGNLADFCGTLAAIGYLRIPSAARLGPRTRILFCGVTTDINVASAYGGGIIETSGTVERRCGTQAGGVAWGLLATADVDLSLRDAETGNSGGFSAVGGPLTVALVASDGTLPLKWEDKGFAPGRLKLQNESATHPLTWTSSVDLNGTMRYVEVGQNNDMLDVLWAGDISDSAGGGSLCLNGSGRFLLSGSANVASGVSLVSRNAQIGADTEETVTIDGSVDFSENYSATAKFLKRGAGSLVLNGENVLKDVVVQAGRLVVGGMTEARSLEVSATSVLSGGGRLRVAGDVTFAEGTRVDFDTSVPPVSGTEIPFLEVEGTIIGRPLPPAAIADDWKLVARSRDGVRRFCLKPRNGGCLVIVR